MPQPSGPSTTDSPDRPGRIHVIGAGPIGLFLAALLQAMDGPPVHLYEKRPSYTRTRMVALAPYLVADSIEAYQADAIDGQSVEAIFDPLELETRLAFRRTIAPDLAGLLSEWTNGFVALKTIEESLSDLIGSRDGGRVERTQGEVSVEQALALAAPGDIIVDATGARSLLRDHLDPGAADDPPGGNTQLFRLEYALVVTFLYSQHYSCNEYCKYYKNIENAEFKFIPAVHRTFYDGSISHVTGIVEIGQADFETMPSRFDGAWLREHFPAIARSMDRFIEKIVEETHGELAGDLEIVRIPLDLYRARHATNGRWHGSGAGRRQTVTPIFLVGDAAMGSPYFQSVSLGFESAFFLAGHFANPSLSVTEVFDRYEAFMYQQWLRVYMRTRMIKHNKDLLESVDDTMGLLAKLHVY